MTTPPPKPEPDTLTITPRLALRAAIGGGLMGLANLVPGISGGTMLVAAGVYRQFIDAVSDVTRLKIRRADLILLALVVGGAIVAIGACSALVSLALASFRWGMYSLFIGLTLGGAPLLVRMIRPFKAAAWVGMAAGIAAMLAVVWVQSGNAGGGVGAAGPAKLILAGAAGASAMILPGVSGAYLLLLLGAYETIIDTIKDFVRALTALDAGAAIDQLGVLIPVGIGVLLGIVVVANILRFVLHHYEKATLGVLLGLLLAAPAGLWPFKQGTPPVVGDNIAGEIVTAETLEAWHDPSEAKKWAESLFVPTPTQIAGSLGLIVLGFGVTLAISKLGGDEDPQ